MHRSLVSEEAPSNLLSNLIFQDIPVSASERCTQNITRDQGEQERTRLMRICSCRRQFAERRTCGCMQRHIHTTCSTRYPGRYAVFLSYLLGHQPTYIPHIYSMDGY